MADGHTPTCPRCGYDLSGPVPTWRESCPLNGVCTECGLDFAWGDVYTGRLLAPKWLIESDGALFRPMSYINTVLKLCIPPLFWRDQTLYQPLRPLRIVWLAFVLVLITMLLNAVPYVVSEFSVATQVNSMKSIRLGDISADVLDEWRAFISSDGSYYERRPMFLFSYSRPPMRGALVPLATWLVLTPWVIVFLFATHRVESFRWSHLWRAWLYAMLFVVFVICMFMLRQTLSHFHHPNLSTWAHWPPRNRWLRDLIWAQPTDIRWPIAMICGVWMLTYWGGFFGRFLKLEKPRYVTASVLAITLLLAMLLFVEELWWLWLGR